MTKLWFVVNLTKCLLFTFLEGDIVRLLSSFLWERATRSLWKNHYCNHKTRHCTAQIWFRVLFRCMKIGPLDSIRILYKILTVRSEDSRLLIFLFMSDWFIERLDMWTYKRSYITNHISGIFNSLLNLSALYQSFHTNHVLKCN